MPPLRGSRYKCNVCEKAVRVIDADGVCEECQEKIKIGEIKLCSVEDCSKKIAIGSEKCKVHQLEDNVCKKCAKVSDTNLDEDGICLRCKQRENEPDKEDKGKKQLPPKDDSTNWKKYLPFLALAIISLFAIGYFSTISSDTGSEDKIVKNQKIKKDTTPNSFAFAEKTNVELATEVVSNEVIINGINEPAKINITNGTYSIDENSWSDRSGKITNNSSIKVKHISSNSFLTSTTTKLNIGGFETTFTTTTKADLQRSPVQQEVGVPIIQDEEECTPLQKSIGEC